MRMVERGLFVSVGVVTVPSMFGILSLNSVLYPKLVNKLVLAST